MNYPLTPSLSPKSFRFVWRGRAKRWFSVTVDATTVPAAIERMQRHIRTKLKRTLSDVVVDHVFYACTPQVDGDQLSMAEPLSLRDMAHPFYIEFDNKVFSPKDSHETR